MTITLGWVLVIAFLASSIFFFVTQKSRRDIVLNRIHIARRRVSGAKTPPRSLSPSKKQAQGLIEPDYVDVFPPSRRHALQDVLPGSATAAEPAIDWSDRMVPLETAYTEAAEALYTPCGFSIEEIKALGDFPDYSALSGVPLPRPYPEFDVQKALPRPYRPFRWAYHQTMCRLV